MWRSWKLGRAFGIPLYVHSTFLLLIGMVVFTGPRGLAGAAFSIALLLAVFSCILLHELGHALMARYFGISTRDITLYPLGGVARLERLNDSPHEELCIAIAGPAVNLAIVVLLAPVVVSLFLLGGQTGFGPEPRFDRGWLTLTTQFIVLLAVSNAVLMLFNLIPAFPMDGGRVLRALLAPFLGTLRATEIAGWLGLFLAGGMAALGLYQGTFTLVLVAVFVVLAGQQEVLMARRREQQRLAASEELVLPEQPDFSFDEGQAPPFPFFTGVTWDGRQGTWVRWHNGRPVAAYAGRKG